MRTKFISVAAASFALGMSLCHGKQDLAAQNQGEQSLIRRIQAGDPGAIAEAGKSGNRAFIPYLRKISKIDIKTGDTAAPTRLALARLGESDVLQEEWCRAISGDPQIGFDAPIEELGLVGGWFAKASRYS